MFFFIQSKKQILCYDVLLRIKKQKKILLSFSRPSRYKLGDIVDWLFKLTRRTAEDYGYRRYDMAWDPLFGLKITLTDRLMTGWPMASLCWERMERECHTDIVDDKQPTLEDLGVTLTHMEDQVPWEVRPHVWQQYYGFGAKTPFPRMGLPKVC